MQGTALNFSAVSGTVRVVPSGHTGGTRVPHVCHTDVPQKRTGTRIIPLLGVQQPLQRCHQQCILYAMTDLGGANDGYAAIAQADRLIQEPESLRKWREEQKVRLEELDAAAKVTEQEWREKAKKDLEEWYLRQSEQIEKNKVTNRASDEALVSETKDEDAGSEWERVARLCDFNPKSSKQSKDVSRLRSVLISLKQTPLSR
ncbi:unnamed protein product [Ranitomeya imitator]|uniref:Clathrin light chain n=1 Tax=Ranitomeya imitator TaxID=111125 RepID=A0ABN9LUQ5_9NEOB|nr:unnamed protein product [Ranitomeya imitator]